MPRFKFIPEESVFDPGPLPEIDKTRKTGLYIRQSGKNADTRYGESRETQLKLKDFAMQLRGDKDLSGAEVYDEKAGKSGTLDTHKRPEIQRLWNDIVLDLIGVIIVARLDRLYRDDIGDQYGAFMRLLKEHNVIVIVPAIKEGQQHRYYDMRDRDHRKAFRMEMEKAGSYIPENIAYLHKCRQQKRTKGFYSGGKLPPGLALDKRHDPETWKPVIYEPWACEMRSIFNRAKELNWNFSLLIRELLARPFIFPDIPDEDNIRFSFRCGMTKVEKGYKVTPRAIQEWFTCLTLTGHWIVDDIHVKPNNHPAVIDPALFEEGYIHMTGEDLQGNPIGKKKRTPKGRKDIENQVTLVLRGIITCPQADFMSHLQRGRVDYYLAKIMPTVDKNDSTAFVVHGPGLDAIVRDRLIEWSEADNTLADRIKKEFYKAHQQQIKSLSSVKASFTEAQLQKTRLETRMAKPTVTDDLYAQMEIELKAVVAKIGKLQEDINVIEKIKGPDHIDRFYHVLKNVRERYEKMGLQEKQTLWQLLTEHITIETISPHWLKLTISWIAPVTHIPDVAYVWRLSPAKGDSFSPEEEALLREVYPKVKSRSELIQFFPERTYSSLKSQASKYTFKGELQSIRFRRIADVDNTLCWLDVLAIPDRELSLAMAHEAIVGCEMKIKGKPGQQLYAIWCMPVNLNEGGKGEDRETSEIEEVIQQQHPLFHSSLLDSPVNIWAVISKVEQVLPDLIRLLA